MKEFCAGYMDCPKCNGRVSIICNNNSGDDDCRFERAVCDNCDRNFKLRIIPKGRKDPLTEMLIDKYELYEVKYVK